MLQEVVRTGEVWQGGGGGMLHRPPSHLDTMHANAMLTPLKRAQMIAELTLSGRSQRALAAPLWRR